MMKKSLLSKLAAVLALSVVFTGCGESGGSRTAEKETSGTMKEEGIRKAADERAMKSVLHKTTSACHFLSLYNIQLS